MGVLTVGTVEAQERLPELLDTVVTGGEVVITRDGQPVARLTGVEAPDRDAARRALEDLAGIAGAGSRSLTLQELLGWRDEARSDRAG